MATARSNPKAVKSVQLSRGKASSLRTDGTAEVSKPDYSPIPVLTKDQIAKITDGEVGSQNLNISERDIVELDAYAGKLYDSLTTPFMEDTILDIKNMNVDKLLNKVKGTLHIDNAPKTIKAIRVLSAQNRPDDALFLWNVLKKDSKKCTLFAWTAYISVLANHGRSALAKSAVKEMVLSGIKPDAHIYGTIVHGLVKEKKLNEAFATSREMMKAGLRPNNVVFSSLIYGCIQSRELARANETFDLMRNYIEEPDAITLALMIKVSELQHHTERAIQLFNSMEVHDQTPTVGCYHAIMHACARSWQYDVQAFDFYQKMQAAGLAPTLQTFHILLEACTQHGDFVKANEVLIELQEKGLEPTVKTYTLLLKVLATASRDGLALPEHPAGGRRFTKEEYKMWKLGPPMAKNRDRLSYVRDLRTREIDDGLPAEGVEEAEAEEEERRALEEASRPLTAEERAALSPSKMIERAFDRKQEGLEGLQQSIHGLIAKDENEKEMLHGRSRGLTENEMNAIIAKESSSSSSSSSSSNAEKEENEPLSAQLRQAVESIVLDRYSIHKTIQQSSLTSSLPSSSSSPTTRTTASLASGPMAMVTAAAGLQDSQAASLASLSALEKTSRSAIETLYGERGGDRSAIDYHSALWKECVEDVLKNDHQLRGSLEGTVRQKMGLTALMGVNLIEQKEKADKAFEEEIAFLRNCYEGDAMHGERLTRLRMAKEMKEEVLKEYSLLTPFEPNMVYRRVCNCI